ncbi:MAG: very short patch repair endonuclease [Planctomycetes bacterium]|nr:very short patch repair endonuclease [Planctomycetota bacterium]
MRAKQTTSRIMAAVRNRDSTAELAIRSRLWANGLRYRLRTKLPGKPDIVFPTQRIAIFVDGDFWHGHAWQTRGLPSLEAQFPSRTDWWMAKISRNMERDREVNEQLRAGGWTVLRYWESDVLGDPNSIARSIAERVRGSELGEFRAIEPTPAERRRLASVRLKGRRNDEATGRE